MRAIGVIEAVAKKLSQTHDPRKVMTVARAATDKDNPAGWTRRALEEGWDVADPAEAKEDELREKAKRCGRDMVKPCPIAQAGHAYSYCQFCEWRED